MTPEKCVVSLTPRLPTSTPQPMKHGTELYPANEMKMGKVIV